MAVSGKAGEILHNNHFIFTPPMKKRSYIVHENIFNMKCECSLCHPHTASLMASSGTPACSRGQSGQTARTDSSHFVHPPRQQM